MLSVQCSHLIAHAMGKTQPWPSAALLWFVEVEPHSTPNSGRTFAVNHVWLCAVVTLHWICSYRDSPAMLAAMASLCNGAAVSWWGFPSICGSKLKLRGFPSILISVYLVITPNLRTVTLARSDPVNEYYVRKTQTLAVVAMPNYISLVRNQTVHLFSPSE